MMDVHVVVLHTVPTALRIIEIEWVLAQDPQLQVVKKCPIKGNCNYAPQP